MMNKAIIPEIIVKGGKDLDGTWGSTKTFTREFYFELINVPIPLFMIAPFIPVYHSLHPLYPFAMAKDSKITNNITTPRGRAVTVSTNYEVLQPAAPLRGLSGFDVEMVIAENMPFLLPAQEVSYGTAAVEETMDDLYIEKTEEEIDDEILEEIIRTGKTRPQIEGSINLWKRTPFCTTAGTKLTGTRTRNILKMSFWYLADPEWFAAADLDDAGIETNYTGIVNHAPVTIAGKNFSTGTVKIESIEVIDDTWERANAEHLKMKRVQVLLLIDKKTWCKEYENVSSLFMAYPYVWEAAGSGEKPDTKMIVDAGTNQPRYSTHMRRATVNGQTETEFFVPSFDEEEVPESFDPIEVSPQRIFCTTYDPEPKNEGDSDDPIWVSDPQKAVQFFGTREDCFRLNPDSEPTEVTEPMYLDKHGFVLYPHPETGKVDVSLSPKVEGYVFMPKDFTPLHFPVT